MIELLYRLKEKLMFVGFSKNLGGGFRIAIGENFNLQPSKTEQKRNEFMFKVRQSIKDIVSDMLIRANIDCNVFEYVLESNVEIDLSQILTPDNCEIFDDVFEKMVEVGNYIQKAEYAESLTSNTKEKITDLLFQAKKSAQKTQMEILAEEKLLEIISQHTNIKKDKMKKMILKQAKKNKKKSTKPSRLKLILKALLVFVIISLLVSIFTDDTQEITTESKNTQIQS